MSPIQQQPTEKNFCTTREAASLLGVSIGSIQQWVERGLLEAWKTDGGHRRVLRQSVNNLLNQKKVALKQSIEPAAAPTPERHRSMLRRLRVLVIDSEKDLLKIYHDTLLQWCMAPEVSTCSGAVAGLVLIGRFSPDLLLVDLQMAGIGGVSLLHTLMDMPEMMETTVLAVSSLDAVSVERLSGVPAGIEVLYKPIDFDHLEEIAMNIASKKHLERRAC